jgi:hypothetical protein
MHINIDSHFAQVSEPMEVVDFKVFADREAFSQPEPPEKYELSQASAVSEPPNFWSSMVKRTADGQLFCTNPECCFCNTNNGIFQYRKFDFDPSLASDLHDIVS